jgi:hypothetical protein
MFFPDTAKWKETYSSVPMWLPSSELVILVQSQYSTLLPDPIIQFHRLNLKVILCANYSGLKFDWV